MTPLRRTTSILLSLFLVSGSLPPETAAQVVNTPAQTAPLTNAAPIVPSIEGRLDLHLGNEFGAPEELAQPSSLLTEEQVLPLSALKQKGARIQEAVVGAEPAAALKNEAQVSDDANIAAVHDEEAAAARKSKTPDAPKDGRKGISSGLSRLADKIAPLLGSLRKNDAASETSLKTGGDELQEALEGGSSSRRAQSEPTRGETRRAAARTANLKNYTLGASAINASRQGLELASHLMLHDILHAATPISLFQSLVKSAGLLTGTFGGALIDVLGAGRAMALTALIQTAAIAWMPMVLTYAGHAVIPALAALFALHEAASTLFEVAQRSALPEIVGKNEGVLRTQNGRLHVFLELAETFGFLFVGAAVQALGVVPAVWLLPLLGVSGSLLLMRLWNLRPKDGSSVVLSSERLTWKTALRSWKSDLLRGLSFARADKDVHSLTLAAVPLQTMEMVFHGLIAVLYADELLGSAALASVLLAAWALGELAGAAYLERRGDKSLFSNWLLLAAGSSLAFSIYVFLPHLWAALPLTFFLALTTRVSQLGIDSLLQSRVPEGELGAVTGFVHGASNTAALIALLAASLAIDALGIPQGLLIICEAFVALSLLYLGAARRFASHPARPR
ncbi:MAG: hypothetical protein WCU88_10650 [Elusimicrobiota bacterium]|jgi:hypothetical protein